MQNKTLELLIPSCRGKFSKEAKDKRYCTALSYSLQKKDLCRYAGPVYKYKNKPYYTCRCDYLGHFLME